MASQKFFLVAAIVAICLFSSTYAFFGDGVYFWKCNGKIYMRRTTWRRCCGGRFVYSTRKHMCCLGRKISISPSGRACCEYRPYLLSTHRCCNRRQIRPKTERC